MIRRWFGAVALCCLVLGCEGPAPNGGVVNVSVIRLAAGSGVTMSAYFAARPVDELEDGAFAGCTVVDRIGDCRRLTCQNLAGATPSQSAGPVELLRNGTTLLTAAPATIYSANASVALDEGEMLTARAVGSLVPAFEVSTTIPGAPTTTLPATQSTSAPLTVSWPSTVSAEEVTLALTYEHGTDSTSFVTCVVPGSQGTATLDPRLMSEAEPGTMGVLALGGARVVYVRTADYQIRYQVAHTTSGLAVTFE